VIVSDSSILILLSAIGRLELLRDFFGQLVVPPAVWREVVEQGRGRLGVHEIEAGRDLDPGEAGGENQAASYRARRAARSGWFLD
jgi:hypothetical protein